MKKISSSGMAGSLGLLCISFALIFCGGCASKEEKTAKHLERARQYIEKNEPQKAVIELRNAIQLDPKNDAAYVELGETYLKLKQGGEAFKAFNTAVSVNPQNMKAQLKVGQILLLGRRTDEAKKKAEMVLEKTPEDIEALGLLSGVQVQEKHVDEAIKTLEKAASVHPKHFNTRLSLARLHLLKSDPDRAAKYYQEAIALDPKSNVPYIELSRLYGTRGQMDKAEAELKKMLDSCGSTYQNLHVLALFYESTGKLDQAEKTHLAAVDASPKEDVGSLMNLGGYYARRKAYDKALEVMKKASDMKKGDPDILLGIAQLHFDFNHLPEGEAALDKILEKDKGHLGANFLKGRVFLAKRDFPRAIERFDLVVKERPNSDMAHYFRALALMGKGESKLAERDLVKAVEMNPGLLDARLILAENYLRERNKDMARQQIEAAAKTAPGDVRVLTLQGNLKILEQDAKGAEEAFRKVVELNPNYVPGYIRLGVLYGLTQRRDEAEKNLKKAIELNPLQADAMGLLVGMYVREKKYDEALKFCEAQKQKIADKPPAAAFVEYLQGSVYMAKNEPPKALSHYRKAVETDPNILAAYEAIARIHFAEKKLDQAKAEYENLLSKNPRHLAGYMALGTIYDLQGDRKKSESYYRKALEIDRDFAPAANNLAWNLVEGGGNIDEALGFAQRAKEKMPKSPAVMDTLGWIYYMKGSYLNAIAQFQDAIELDKDNPVIHYHLGMAYFKGNQPEKAREFLDKALNLDPKFKGAEEARATLQQIKAAGKG